MNADTKMSARFGRRLLIACAALAMIAAFSIGGCSKASSSADTSANAVPTTAGSHEARGAKCADCHEGADSADYTAAKSDKCLKCHGSYEKIASSDSTVSAGYPVYNPHVSHYTDLECANCHTIHTQEHGASVLWCTSCHEGMPIPEGWEAAPFGDFVPKWVK